jgi:hypothetical protein
MMEWLGRPLDPVAFDVNWVNVALGRLTWPRVTEGRLGRVLMARDRVLE